MEKTVIKVDGMMCEHCVTAVTKAVKALSGVGYVKVELEAGTVEVEYEPMKSSLAAIKEAIEDQGYEIAA